MDERQRISKRIASNKTDTDYHFYNLERDKEEKEEEEEGCHLPSGGDVSNAAAPVVVVTGHWSAW